MAGMKTRLLRPWWVLVVALLPGVRPMQAAPPLEEGAKARAVAFQGAVRTALQTHGWRVTRDQPGRLIADHYLGFSSAGESQLESLHGADVSGVARVKLTFQPINQVDTNCTAKLERYIYGPTKDRDGYYLLYGPAPLKEPGILKEIDQTLTKAHARMVAAHPEFTEKN